MFQPDKRDLRDLLEEARDGCLQLPDFQRDYVWTDDDVRSLIASVARGYPIGALLSLEIGGEVQFKPRLLAGVPLKQEIPEELLLDGQQRVTSLYQALFSDQPVRTLSSRQTEIKRYYYLDISKAVSAGADIEDAIVGVPSDRIRRINLGRDIDLDLSTNEKEYEKQMFPLNKVFDNRNWFFGWKEYWKPRGHDVSDLEKEFFYDVIDVIERYEVPIIQLNKKNTRAGICLVFEKVNVGGKKLDAFELLTAIFAADEHDLREDWYGSADQSKVGRKRKIVGSPTPCDVLTKFASTDFLQACTLLHTRERRVARAKDGIQGRDLPQVSCKRDAMLELPLTGYKAHAQAVEDGLISAGRFLNELKIISHRDIPYPPMIIGIASVNAILGKEATTIVAKEKLAQWFWSVTFGELFGSSTETRLARDVSELVDWIRGNGLKPRVFEEAIFQQERLRSLRSRNSAAYKGVYSLLMQQGCRDFVTGRTTDLMTYFNDQIDIHHIFPRAWCNTQGIEPTIFNSIVNKTPLSKQTNQFIGGSAPSRYLQKIEREISVSSDKLDEILRSHLIEPYHLRNDDFESFFETRMNALSDAIERAMDKPVVKEKGNNEEERDIDFEDDEFLNLDIAA